eukprot:tig00020903_g15076.t1
MALAEYARLLDEESESSSEAEKAFDEAKTAAEDAYAEKAGFEELVTGFDDGTMQKAYAGLEELKEPESCDREETLAEPQVRRELEEYPDVLELDASEAGDVDVDAPTFAGSSAKLKSLEVTAWLELVKAGWSTWWSGSAVA